MKEKICDNCKHQVRTKYLKQYGGIVVGCDIEKIERYQYPNCFEPKEEDKNELHTRTMEG